MNTQTAKPGNTHLSPDKQSQLTGGFVDVDHDDHLLNLFKKWKSHNKEYQQEIYRAANQTLKWKWGRRPTYKCQGY